MSDLQSDLPEAEDDNPQIKFATFDELVAQVISRPNIRAIVIYETDDGRLGYLNSGGGLWAENAARYAMRCISEDVERLRQRMQAHFNEQNNGNGSD